VKGKWTPLWIPCFFSTPVHSRPQGWPPHRAPVGHRARNDARHRSVRLTNRLSLASDPVKAPEGSEHPSSIQRALDIVGDRWTILILRNVFRGLHRFDDLRRDLAISRPVLADRLARLVDAGVLERRPYQDRPVRHEYRLTPMGLELSPILVALMRWGDTWLAGADGPAVVLVHGECGHPLDQALVCWTCNTTVTPLGIRARPTGPDPTGAPS
jgi:DNA-binding HxlR family transcriptional regulator